MAFIASTIELLANLYVWVIIIYVAISWLIAFDILNVRNYNARRIVAFFNALVEPVLNPIRRVIPPIAGIDVSPIILIIGLELLKRLAWYLTAL